MERVSVEQAIIGVVANKGSHHLGRTRLVKCLYFLQHVADLNTDLQFELYTWGPFDQRILEEVNRLVQEGVLCEDKPDPENERSSYDYKIAAGDESANSTLSAQQLQTLEWLMDHKADQLEALSTLHFAATQLGAENSELVVQRVKNLKPYFKVEDLQAYWRELEEKEWVK